MSFKELPQDISELLLFVSR